MAGAQDPGEVASTRARSGRTPAVLPERRAERLLVVSIHDVASSTLDDVEWLLARLDDMAASPRVLKVVPAPDVMSRDAHRPRSSTPRDSPRAVRGVGRGMLEPAGESPPPALDAGVSALARREAARGHEIVLHGWTHRRAGPLRGPWYDRLRGRLFAWDSAEFLSLPAASVTERLRVGRDVLAAAGIAVAGFCAPGWLASPDVAPALRALGFRYDVRFASVRDLVCGHTRAVPALGYMGPDPGQERLVRIEAALVLAAEPRLPALRVFLHPAGARTSRDAARVLSLVERLTARRAPVTYGELLDSSAGSVWHG